MWVEEFGIDGIRLDAADALSPEFMVHLRDFVSQNHPGLWLMGEVIHGDYRAWANDKMLNATTNYELYKSSYSSLNDNNFFLSSPTVSTGSLLRAACTRICRRCITLSIITM